MKDQIPEFLKKNLTNKSAFPKFFPDEMKQFIYEYGVFYNYPNKKKLEGDKLLSLWFRFMKSGIAEVGICELEGCDGKQYIRHDGKTNRFLISRGCCIGHSNKIASLEKFGVENPMHVESIKRKIRKTNIERYGVENPMQNREIRGRLEKTMNDKYGVPNIFKDTVYMKSKFKSKYGVENPSNVPEFQQKKVDTCLRKYGKENPNQVESVKRKIAATCRERYGVDHVIMTIDGYKRKPFKWKSGEVSMVQGYEPIVLGELESEGYNFEKVLTEPWDMPKIIYVFNGTEHRYYPDIYIPSENLIIEVKSNYTLNKEWDQNQKKFEAVKEAGFDFRLEVR